MTNEKRKSAKAGKRREILRSAQNDGWARETCEDRTEERSFAALRMTNGERKSAKGENRREILRFAQDDGRARETCEDRIEERSFAALRMTSKGKGATDKRDSSLCSE